MNSLNKPQSYSVRFLSFKTIILSKINTQVKSPQFSRLQYIAYYKLFLNLIATVLRHLRAALRHYFHLVHRNFFSHQRSKKKSAIFAFAVRVCFVECVKYDIMILVIAIKYILHMMIPTATVRLHKMIVKPFKVE